LAKTRTLTKLPEDSNYSKPEVHLPDPEVRSMNS